RDLDLLTLFASQVSIAIENARFFEELNAARQRAEAYREMLEESNRRLASTNDELQHLAVHDPLTGLPNRTLIIDRLQQGILAAKRDQDAMSLVMIDLDHFKEVNDTLGHPVGDELLRKVGKRFLSVLREPDTLGRLGGDEFAVVLTQADSDDAVTVARKLQESLERPLEIEENSFLIGCSIGVASYPRHEQTPAGLLKAADVAMYAAKRSHEEYCVYDPELDRHNPDRLGLLHDLRLAIQNGDIGLAFQPKLDLRDDCVVGVEALARWSHPERGAIPPFEFIPVLEHTGLIRAFTLQVIELAAGYCRRCRDQGFAISVALNLSMHNLMDENLPRQVRQVLDRYRLDERCLTLEITESAIMNDPERSMEILTELHRMGLQLSVDDFGTGYSSLSYLKRLPVQQLKIDRSFVSNLLQDRDDEMIVRSTIDLAHNLGLETVAEGVETQETLERLQAMGCDLVQGYLIARPLTGDDFLGRLRSGEWSARQLPDDAASA
ncbi:MAG TPA: EAL domain-containing protein, partial [Gammaproteobacteria bacterium]|nr:EAL domain-containing protein [Gammaproteobacteria bacterium]